MSNTLKAEHRALAELMPAVAVHLGMATFSAERGIDAYLPYLDRMRAAGCHVLLKVDGPRPGKNQYTAVASGRPLGEETLHTDATSLVLAAAYVVVRYARACWGFSQ